MMMSQILRSVDLTKSQKPRYIENKTSFTLQIKKMINYKSKATLLAKNSFAVDL